MKCKNCEKELAGKQKIFCSSSCKSKSYNKTRDKERGKELNKIWRDKRKKEISLQKKEYYQRHKEKLKEKRKEYHKEHPEVDRLWKQSPKGRMMTYKRGARDRKLLFNLDLKFFEENFNKQCAYCGDTIKGIGIDRVDSSIGYEIDNVVMCCEMCNKMKLHHRKEVFIEHCRKITNFNS